MKFSRAVDYAIRATLQLARRDHEAPVPCRQLASQESIPERFLLQILRTLVENGVSTSTRGVEGGYQLTQPANQTSLLQVIEAVEGRIVSTNILSDGLPDDTVCRLREEFNQVVDATRHRLGAVKLSTLINGG